MKILLVNHFPLQGSGSGIYTMNIARELVKKKHDVMVIDIDNQIDKNDYIFQRKTIICDKTKNENYDLEFNFPCFTTHPGSNLTYYDLSDNQIKDYIHVYIQAIENAVQSFKPDIIHAQHLWIVPYAAMKTKIPYVITTHGTDLMGFEKDKRYHKYAIKAALGAKKIITISKQVHNRILELFDVKETNLQLNPNGFDNSIFKVKKVNKKKFCEQFGIIYKPGQKIISFVGKFTNFKGIDILLKAAGLINDEISDIIFCLAGEGDKEEKMKSLSDSLGLDNVYFIGHQDQNIISLLYNIADLSIVPSRVEPFGLVAIEALACGTPVVATNAGGLPDFINNKIGQLVKMEDHRALAKAVIRELKNNTKKTKGKYAQKYASDNYSWDKTIEKVIETYQ